MGTYLLKGEVGMRLACVTLRLSLRKGVYVGHIQWDSTRKAPMKWFNLCVAKVLGMWDYIFARDNKNFTDTDCLTKGPCFGYLMR